MLRSYFIIAWRNLIKDRQFGFLNLFGLSTRLACVFLIFLWVDDELHVDKFNVNDDRLYQALKRAPDENGGVEVHETTQGLLAETMAKDLPFREKA